MKLTDKNCNIIYWNCLIHTVCQIMFIKQQRCLLDLLIIAKEQRAEEIADIKGEIVEAAWGNQIRNYVFNPYQLIKDLRTNQESTDVEGFLNGNIDNFIYGLLRLNVSSEKI